MSRRPVSRGRADEDDDRPHHGNAADDYSDREDDRSTSSDDDDGRGDDDEDRLSSRRSRRRVKHSGEEEKKAEITNERTVIHEALIRRAIHKELKTHYDPAVVPLESELELASYDTLVLSYCNIYAIDNLQGFESLTHLNLNNNIIEKIEHLDHLVNLTWLDLRSVAHKCDS